MIQYRHAYRFEFMLKPTPRVQQPIAQGECKLSLRALFDAEEGPLLRYAFSLTGRRAVAEEIVQDVFLELHTNWSDVDAPKAWLMRCVRNKAFTHLRSNRQEVLSSDKCETSGLYAEEETPEETLSRMEATGALRTILAGFSAIDRELVRLKYFEDHKYADISALTGLSIGNVGYRLHHILKQLAAKLKQLGIDEKS